MSDISHRLAAMRRRLAAADPPLDAMLVTQPENRRYLSGFTGSAGQLLVTPAAAILLTDFRYVEQAAAQAPAYEVVKVAGHEWNAIAEQTARLGVRRLGIEAGHVTMDLYERLQAALSATESQAALAPQRGFVEALRHVKDPAEVEAIRRAVLIGDRAFEQVARSLRPGATESEVAWRLEVAMRQDGAEGLSFPIIVASGPNAAMPHHRASAREIRAGEPVIIDMGCRVDGYCSDMTRTITLGEPPPRFWQVFNLVLAAQRRCEDGFRAGMLGREGDKLARDVIAAAGNGDDFGHGTGHGVGLAIHEDPYLSPVRGDEPVQKGAVVTVEPGVYLAGWGGVRIEDMVVVGESRCHVLTTAHKFPVVDIHS